MAVIGLRKPREQRVLPQPAIGDVLPTAASYASDRPYRCIVFLRHVGCPFAEQTVKALRDLSALEPRVAVFFVSHGDAGTARAWLADIGGASSATWIDDPSRDSYGACGLGYTRAAHFLGGASLGGAIGLRRAGIRNRIASGTRWQSAGAFLVDRAGRVLWKHVPRTANEVPDEAAIRAQIEKFAAA